MAEPFAVCGGYRAFAPAPLPPSDCLGRGARTARSPAQTRPSAVSRVKGEITKNAMKINAFCDLMVYRLRREI